MTMMDEATRSLRDEQQKAESEAVLRAAFSNYPKHYADSLWQARDLFQKFHNNDQAIITGRDDVMDRVFNSRTSEGKLLGNDAEFIILMSRIAHEISRLQFWPIPSRDDDPERKSR